MTKISVRTTTNFDRDVKRLRKKYRHLGDDVQPLIERLQAGETPGDQIPGVGYPVYKERIPNTDAQAGQRGGYRVIYYIQTAATVYLVTMYSKTERSDVPIEEIRKVIEAEIEQQPPAEE